MIAYLDVGFYSAPALADLDGDGLLDLTLGTERGGTFICSRTPARHSLRRSHGRRETLSETPGSLDTNPTWVDLNDDGLP